MELFWTEVSNAAIIIYQHETRGGKVQIAAALRVLNMEVTGDPEDVVRVEFRFDRLRNRLPLTTHSGYWAALRRAHCMASAVIR